MEYFTLKQEYQFRTISLPNIRVLGLYAAEEFFLTPLHLGIKINDGKNKLPISNCNFILHNFSLSNLKLFVRTNKIVASIDSSVSNLFYQWKLHVLLIKHNSHHLILFKSKGRKYTFHTQFF